MSRAPITTPLTSSASAGRWGRRPRQRICCGRFQGQGISRADGSARSRASGPCSDGNGLGIGAAARSRCGCGALDAARQPFWNDRADRAGLPPISLSRLRQTVQRTQREPVEPPHYPSGPICITTKTAAKHGTGSAAIMRRRGSRPPAEAAMTTTPVIVRRLHRLRGVGSLLIGASPRA
jgi:hypothetical protein